MLVLLLLIGATISDGIVVLYVLALSFCLRWHLTLSIFSL
jgi:hypothetical protein